MVAGLRAAIDGAARRVNNLYTQVIEFKMRRRRLWRNHAAFLLFRVWRLWRMRR
jgi:hypothetical protein